MKLKESNASFVEQLRNAQKLSERTREYEIEENGKVITIDLIPLNDSDIVKLTKQLDKADENSEKLLELAQGVISKNVRQIRDAEDEELNTLGVDTKYELISAYFNFKNQVKIMGAVMKFSSEAKDDEVDETFRTAEELKN